METVWTYFAARESWSPKFFRLHLQGMDFTPEKTVLGVQCKGCPRAEWLLESNGIQLVLDPRNDHIRGDINQHSVVPPGSQYWRAAGCHHWQAAGHTAQGTQRDGTEAAARGADAQTWGLSWEHMGTGAVRICQRMNGNEMFRSKLQTGSDSSA